MVSGSGHDQADDQQEDDARSLCWDSAPLETPVEILGVPILTARVAADKPIATVVARLCHVFPSGESRRVSFGILNLIHRDCDDHPSPLEPGEQYTVRIKLKCAGASFAPGHRLRLALSTAYWPMVWPAPETATVTVFGGTLELPVRHGRAERPPTMPPAETARPAPPSKVASNVVRFDRISLLVGSDACFSYDVREDDPLSATAWMRRSDTVMRRRWQVRIETSLSLTATLDSFVLHASVRAFEGDPEICRRQWNRTVARRLV
jgi:hypothetical protein